MKKISLCLLFFWIITVSAQTPDPGTEQQRKSGEELYMKKCAQCHGVDGDGQGVATPYFKPQPRNFRATQFKIRTTGSGELPTDKDLFQIIKRGMPYTGMPAWPDLTDEEVKNLVYFIKTFSEDFADPDYYPVGREIPDGPSFSKESADSGRKVFETNECIKCHGNFGRGDGPSAKTLTNDAGNHIKPADLTKRWTFRGGGTREDIYRTFTTGLNGTPMPSYHGLISPEKQWQLVDYVYSLSRDNPEYASLVVAKGINKSIDSLSSIYFDQSPVAFFPIVGQVIEPGREFFPGVNALGVQAVYNNDEIAIMLTWNDMSAETDGKNGPDIKITETNEEEQSDDFFDDPFAGEEEESFSDAVAIQLPAKIPDGQAKPYMLFGDARNPVDLWFIDLAKDEPDVYSARGSANITMNETDTLHIKSEYKEGQWTVIFKHARWPQEGLDFPEGTFIPVAFSVWDGFNKERGNKRGISSWYHLYLEPMETASVAWPMFKWALITLVIEMIIVFSVRKKYKKTKAES